MKIPRINVGTGSPHVAVISGIHGDERSGILVQRALQETPPKKGTLHLIGPVNVKAWTQGKRYVDVDLNRSYPDPSPETVEGPLAQQLRSLLAEVDLVIDLHTFRMTTQLTVVQTYQTELIEYFQPDLIWHINTNAAMNKEYAKTLGLALTLQSTPNFAVELPPVEEITADMVKRCADSIRNVITQRKEPQRPIPVVSRKKFASEHSGVFIPEKPIMTQVREGDTVGKLITNIEETKHIKTTKSGILLQRRHQSWIESGETIYAIGEYK